MKISNSKKKLAKIISENGGWRRGGDYAAQDKDDMSVCFYSNGKPTKDAGCEYWSTFGSSAKVMAGEGRLKVMELCANWHQTILSRDEYFNLYPELDSSLVAMCEGVTEENKHPEYCESVMRSIPEPSYKPTIEQLASDCKAKLEISQQAQEEADSRRADAEAALDRLYQAGLEIGLDIAIASKEDEDEGEPGLVITDWQDLRVGDEVECVEPNIRKDRYGGQIGVVCDIDESDSFTPVLVSVLGSNIWCNKVKFIHRP